MLPVCSSLQELLEVLGAAGVLAVDRYKGGAGLRGRLIIGNLKIKYTVTVYHWPDCTVNLAAFRCNILSQSNM